MRRVGIGLSLTGGLALAAPAREVSLSKAVDRMAKAREGRSSTSGRPTSTAMVAPSSSPNRRVDADADRGPRTIVSTASVPKHGDPTGMLVALPNGARWLRGTRDVEPQLPAGVVCCAR